MNRRTPNLDCGNSLPLSFLARLCSRHVSVTTEREESGDESPHSKFGSLGADIDEAAWSTLYSTTSQPFVKPATGKIAVKVINHYGDEVLKVYTVNAPT